MGGCACAGEQDLRADAEEPNPGDEPLDVAAIFYKIKQHGDHGVAGGGVSAVEMACWDLAGKAWGVPVWQMLGGKFRDKILLYADTESSSNAEEMAKHLLGRIPDGFKFLKMDLNVGAIAGAGNVVRPAPTTAEGLPGMPRSPPVQRRPYHREGTAESRGLLRRGSRAGGVEYSHRHGPLRQLQRGEHH